MLIRLLNTSCSFLSFDAGKCRSEIDMFCLGVEPGERRLADCLQTQLAAEAAPDFSGPHQWTDGCRAELDAFMMETATNINKNLPLGGM